MKTCTKCHVTQELSCFHKGNNPDGYRTWCKTCVAEYKKEYTKINIEKIVKQRKEYFQKKYPSLKKYYQDRYLKLSKEINEKNRLRRASKPHTHANKESQRRAAKLQRTPKWLTEDDFWMIEQAYELAALRTKMLGFSWHVDHVIPLKGKKVSGLHVPTNLQVIPGLENIKKHNKYEVTF